MRQGKNICFKGSYVSSVSPVHSPFTYKQRYAMDLIVEELNDSLLKTGKLYFAKRPYNRDDVIRMVKKVKNIQKCENWDDAIKILKKQLKEKNFDIYKS